VVTASGGGATRWLARHGHGDDAAGMRSRIAASSCLCLLLLAACETLPSAPARPNTIYLLGRFPAPHPREQLAAELRPRGYRIAIDLDDSVDTVVVGMPPLAPDGDRLLALEDVPEYRRAVRRDLRQLTPEQAMALPAR
jgi:hypothetical protein